MKAIKVETDATASPNILTAAFQVIRRKRHIIIPNHRENLLGARPDLYMVEQVGLRSGSHVSPATHYIVEHMYSAPRSAPLINPF